MKRFAFATIAALSLLALTQQQAHAWASLSAGGSGSFNLSFGGKTKYSAKEPWPSNCYGNPAFNYYGPAGGVPGFAPNCYGPGYGYGYGYGGYGYGNGCGYAATQVAPSNYLGLQPVPAGPYAQQVGYYYGYEVPAYYYYGYGVPYYYGR